jgi:hypothetical protein
MSRMWDLVCNLFRGRFSLAVLLVVVTAVAIACGVVRWKWVAAQEQAAVIATLAKHDYQACYAWQRNQPAEPDGPAWLRSWLGDDFFNEPFSVGVAWYGSPEPIAKDDSGRMIGWLNALPSLESVELDGRATLGGSLGELRLPRLKKLSVSGQRVTDADLRAISQESPLESLHVSRGQVTGSCLPVLFERHSLRTLGLTYCPLDKQWIELVAGEESLENLFLSSPHLTDDAVAKIARLPRLARLWISGELTEGICEPLARCRTLEDLTFTRVPLTSVGLTHLAGLSGLQNLDLEDCGISNESVDLLLTFPALHILRLDGVTLTPENEARLKARIPHVILSPPRE